MLFGVPALMDCVLSVTAEWRWCHQLASHGILEVSFATCSSFPLEVSAISLPKEHAYDGKEVLQQAGPLQVDSRRAEWAQDLIQGGHAPR